MNKDSLFNKAFAPEYRDGKVWRYGHSGGLRSVDLPATEEDRTLVKLRKLGLTFDAIGRVLGITKSMARERFRIARYRLKVYLD